MVEIGAWNRSQTDLCIVSEATWADRTGSRPQMHARLAAREGEILTLVQTIQAERGRRSAGSDDGVSHRRNDRAQSQWLMVE